MPASFAAVVSMPVLAKPSADVAVAASALSRNSAGESAALLLDRFAAAEIAAATWSLAHFPAVGIAVNGKSADLSDPAPLSANHRGNRHWHADY